MRYREASDGGGHRLFQQFKSLAHQRIISGKPFYQSYSAE
jgi:hypothetical protein